MKFSAKLHQAGKQLWQEALSKFQTVSREHEKGARAMAQGNASREAPVGHRQPKAGEVPQEQQQTSDQ
jgi:hypothetical protein